VKPLVWEMFEHFEIVFDFAKCILYGLFSFQIVVLTCGCRFI
jgi:hypothetical protein